MTIFKIEHCWDFIYISFMYSTELCINDKNILVRKPITHIYNIIELLNG
jgi:hypothetical protein